MIATGYLAVLMIVTLIIVATIVWFIRTAKKYNTIDWGISWLNIVDGMLRWFCLKYHHLDFERLPLPETGGAIIASNHISGLDPFLLIAASDRPLRFLIAREEYDRFGLRWLFKGSGCIPVERSGRPERALREALRQLELGEVIALFPHGGIHLDSDPERKLKAGVLRLSQLGQSPVYPVRLEGVKGEGKVVMAVLQRSSRVLLKNLSVFQCQGATDCDCLVDLSAVLSGHGPDVSGKIDCRSGDQTSGLPEKYNSKKQHRSA